MGLRTDLNNHINRQVRLSTLYSVVPLDTAQYDSLSRLPTPHSNSRPMLLARPNCMHVSWRLSTPSMRNVAPTQRRFLMSVANASCFRHSCVPPEPSEPRWRKNATVYAKPSCTSSRKVRLVSHKKNKKHAPHVSTVEVCNDYSLWPHSGLASTSLASMIFFFSVSFFHFRSFEMTDSPTKAASPPRAAADDVDRGCTRVLSCTAHHTTRRVRTRACSAH